METKTAELTLQAARAAVADLERRKLALEEQIAGSWRGSLCDADSYPPEDAERDQAELRRLEHEIDAARRKVAGFEAGLSDLRARDNEQALEAALAELENVARELEGLTDEFACCWTETLNVLERLGKLRLLHQELIGRACHPFLAVYPEQRAPGVQADAYHDCLIKHRLAIMPANGGLMDRILRTLEHTTLPRFEGHERSTNAKEQ